MSDPKLVFVSRIRACSPSASVCEVYNGAALNGVEDDPLNWQEVFRGSQEECANYTANLHHAIDPEMSEKFNPRRDVRRRI